MGVFHSSGLAQNLIEHTVHCTRPSLNSLFLNTVNWIYHALKALCSLEHDDMKQYKFIL